MKRATLEAPVSAKTALLQALVSGPGYGRELIDRVVERTEGEVRLHQGSVYPALRGLERDGLVESYEDYTAADQRGGRPRIYYKLTGEGAKVAQGQRKRLLPLFYGGPEPAPS